jgi:hypothetical protein
MLIIELGNKYESIYQCCVISLRTITQKFQNRHEAGVCTVLADPGPGTRSAMFTSFFCLHEM